MEGTVPHARPTPALDALIRFMIHLPLPASDDDVLKVVSELIGLMAQDQYEQA
jgi:hypothetical protein